MIINEIRVMDQPLSPAAAWRHISNFQNTNFVARVICDLHGLSGKHTSNARRQAEEIRHCLSQAREYFSAADAVSIATKPVLLYYGVMSLALAEVLLKQTADSRLEKLRQAHGAHGLSLHTAGDVSVKRDFRGIVESLVAKPQRDSARGNFGTFEVWRQSAREALLSGNYYFSNGAVGHRVLMRAEDVPLIFPAAGLSLYQCIQALPYFESDMATGSIPPSWVRIHVSEREGAEPGSVHLNFTLQPCDDDQREAFDKRFLFSPDTVNACTVKEYPNGYTAEFDLKRAVIASLPGAIQMKLGTAFISLAPNPLNEFGYLYVALHILGNFARYFPEKWLQHIEESTSFAVAVEHLMGKAIERLPILALSELSRMQIVDAVSV